MSKASPLSTSARAVATAAALFLAATAHAGDSQPLGRPLKAEPGDFSLKIESGVVIPLTTPQSQLFMVGGGQTIKAMWALNEYLDLGPSITFMGLQNQADSDKVGTAWNFGASLRLQRPHHHETLLGISPWVDVDALYVRTGALNRPGFAAAVGAAIPLGEKRVFWIGPFARYTHVIQLDRPGYDNHDAKLLTIGLSLEVGSGVRREAVAVAPEIRTINTNTETFSCPDRDGDSIPDNVDHCPEVAGPMDFWGCPAYKKLVVKKDKLELREKLYFAWNAALLDKESLDTLDEVAQALKDNKNFRVQVEGHTSSEGGDDHNQSLSEARAQAVLEYLVAHGVGKERLIAKGFGGSVPRDTNTTSEGRDNNRRVEFVVNFIIINPGTN
ncbi:MAG: OmpA family protein [Archangium sp.]|nr:OmpA family protein [Archangium sp.]MDP3572814.1 OmpA family protein [Archangium sp.]